MIHSRAVQRATLAAAALVLAAGTGLAVAAVPAAASGGHSVSSAPNYKAVCKASTNPRIAACMALIRTDVRSASRPALANPASSASDVAYSPAQLESAYDLPSTTAGVGESVAVVDAYRDPNAVSDVAKYRSYYALPACNKSTEAGCLTVVNEKGKASPLPAKAVVEGGSGPSAGWAVEESLDVDMVSAICPKCHIYLVEANTSSFSDLGTAVNSAVSVLHVDFISNSYGGSDSSSDTTFDTDYYNHPGIAITASAGDDGYFGSGVEYPAASKDVVAVGGTTLRTSTNARGWTETVWGTSAGEDGTGSGCSQFEPKPSWQNKSFDSGCSKRTNNDVSADANPDTGAWVYDSYDFGTANAWEPIGGTSEASPIIASVFALAGVPAAGTYPASYIYAQKSDLYDVTSGTDGSPCTPTYLCKARTGYDGPTGWGTPHGITAFES
jgi:subtilase family serine protease